MENNHHNHRCADQPYIIQLDNDYYCLTQEVINQNAELKIIRRKDWRQIKQKFLSLENGVLKLAVTSPENKEGFELTIKIGKDKLHVSCSCGQPVEKLCSHAYAALSHVSYSHVDSGFFEKHRAGGPVELALKHRKHFRIRQTNYNTDVEQNEALGSIYKISAEDPPDSVINLLKLKGTPAPKIAVKEETALSYLLMCSSWRTLPFLIPAEAVLNKAGNAPKGFVKYIQTADDPMLNGESAICKKCFKLMELVKQLPGTIEDAAEGNVSLLEEVFQLWKEVWPLVKRQPFVLKSEHWLWRLLKQKPRKSVTYPVNISNIVPQVQFELIDKGAYYRLQLNILINNAALTNYDFCRLIIFHKDQAYLLGSLRDAAIIELWNKLGGFLTVFKEHFDDFEERALFELSDNYFVKKYSENH
ncbi:MAG: hypothetical protein J7502_16125 [Flavisolibacter sp.]|nr:hypothetical protein [Flavisolibacter sp.]